MADYAKKLSSWAGFSGKKGQGYCVICGEHGKLTRDHVPPQGCVKLTAAVLSRLTTDPDNDEKNRDTIYIQGGLKFQTLCGECNGARLGLRFDPELKHFVDSMRAGLQKISMNVVLPRIVRVDADMHLVARSVIGHILASHAVSNTEIVRDNIGASEVLRQYFLDPESSFPEDWRLYCWPYLSRKQVILKHGAWLDTSLANAGQKTVYGHVLKFLPFGFWLVYKQPLEFHINAPELTPSGLPDARRASVEFDLRHAPHWSYPEHPHDDMIMAFANDQSSVASPVLRKGKG